MEGQRPVLDDPEICDSEALYRSVHRMLWQQKPGERTSAMFGDKRKWEISVDRGSLCTPEETLARLPGQVGVLQLSAGIARATRNVAGVKASRKPDNPAHADILRERHATNGEWHKATRELARASTWAIEPSPAGGS